MDTSSLTLCTLVLSHSSGRGMPHTQPLPLPLPLTVTTLTSQTHDDERQSPTCVRSPVQSHTTTCLPGLPTGACRQNFGINKIFDRPH